MTAVGNKKKLSTVLEQPAMLTTTDVARLMACSKKTVYRLADRGAIPRPVKLGNMLRWSRHPFEQWIADGCPKPRS